MIIESVANAPELVSCTSSRIDRLDVECGLFFQFAHFIGDDWETMLFVRRDKRLGYYCEGARLLGEQTGKMKPALVLLGNIWPSSQELRFRIAGLAEKLKDKSFRFLEFDVSRRCDPEFLKYEGERFDRFTYTKGFIVTPLERPPKGLIV